MKQAVARVLCHPIVGRGVLGLFGNSVPSRGLRFDLGPDPDPRVAARLAWGLYESAEIRFVANNLRADLDVVELGGSLGVVSSFIGQRLQQRQRLVVVEASPVLVPLIRSNVARNAPAMSLEVVHGALDYGVPEGAMVRFAVERDTTRGRSANSGEPALEVPAIRLSGLLGRLGIDEFALVCDVEGAEWGLIEHDVAALDRCRQIIIELHDAPPPLEGNTADLRQRLLRDGRFVEKGRRGPVLCLERSA